MANTLNLGNGNWGVKKDSLLAYNSENGNFKPLPFDFTRASSATVVNKAGLIETVGGGEPRIDFSNDAKGALLLEPTRSNLVTYSEDFSQSYWTKSNTTLTSGFTSPKGDLSAFKLVEDTSTGAHSLSAIYASSQTGYKTWSICAKAGERNWFVINAYYGGDYKTYFDLTNGVVGTSASGNTSTITKLANGWYRCTVTRTSVTPHTIYNGYGVAEADNDDSFSGNGTSGVYIWGAQLEQGSYATSYIPTQGSAVTRVADSSSQTVPSGVIGQTEGTMFIDGIINGKNSSVNRRIFTISNGTSSTAINIQTPAQNSKLEFEVTNGGATQVFISADNNSLVYGQNFKAAFAYKSNDFVAYINGVQIGTDTNGTVPTCEKVSFDRGNNTSNFEGSVNQTKLYNTRLSNAELAALTKI